MGSFRGHVNLRPRRPLTGRIARWHAAREAARDAVQLPRPANPAARRPALVAIPSGLARPVSRR
jgi:hypothetical protein